MTRGPINREVVGQQGLPFFDGPNFEIEEPTQPDSASLDANHGIEVESLLPIIRRSREIDPKCWEFLHSKGIEVDDPRGARFRRGKTGAHYSVVRDIERLPRATDIPNGSMRQVHQYLLDHMLEVYWDHVSAIACGVKGRSLGDMVAPHAESRYFMKVDLSSAYDHVDISRLARIVDELEQQYGHAPDAEGWDAFLCHFCKSPRTPGLATGANASPLLFNLYMRPLDDQLMELAERYGLVYTRYMDDFVLSAPDGAPIGRQKKTAIKQAMRRYGFELNQRKVRYHDLRRDGPFIITGVQINPSGNWQMPTRYLKNVLKKMEEEFNAYLDRPEYGIDVSNMGSIRGLHGHLKSCMMPGRKPTDIESKILTVYHVLERIYRSDSRNQY